MQFRIGNIVYTVRRKWELKHNGERMDGLCDSTNKLIWLDGEMTGDEVLPILRHEHTHAWAYEVGQPRTFEDLACFAATVADAFDAEFAEQGGIESLMAIPLEGLRPGARKQIEARPLNICDRIECGRCGATIMVGSIFTGTPRVIDSINFVAVDRGCQCPVCDAVQVWSERSTSEGIPIGEFFNAKLLEGDEAREWAEQHRELHSPYNVG
jgi:hypothetical protein